MLILGFNCYAHNAAACLVDDGVIVAYVQEERLNRIKNYGALPERAVQWCLDSAGVEIGDVAHVAFHWQPFHGLHRRIAHVLRQLPKARRMAGTHLGVWSDLALASTRFRRRFPPRRGRRAPRMWHVRHHTAHAASAFLCSPFERASILTIDGNGEIASAQWARGRGSSIDVIGSVEYPHSLGYVYAAVTHYLGFDPNGDQYKVMGLAPYGDRRFVEDFRGLIQPVPRGFRVDLSYFDYPHGGRTPWVSPRFEGRFGPRRRPDEELSDGHRAVAYALQNRLEEIALHLTRELHAATGDDALCLAGGVALNSAMNGVLRRRGPFARIWTQPAADDAGTCIGAALWVHHAVDPASARAPLLDVYVGPGFDDGECRRALDAAGLSYSVLSDGDRATTVARLLEQGRVVGWFQGRMGIGARALGDRSILADPRSAVMRGLVNDKVKHREPFRPFAPSVLEEVAGDWFEGCTRAPHMMEVYEVRPEKRSAIAAVTHVDGTSRVQTVSRQTTPHFYELISAFGARTGVPMVLNTSFNVAGEPIVCSPEDAVACYSSTGIDALAIGPYLAVKEPPRK